MNNNNLEIRNNMYNYVGPANRLKVGKEVTELIKNKNCNPRRVFHRIAGNNAELMVREIVTTLPLRFKPKNGKVIKGIREIGKGAEGVVYLGCLDKKCKKSVAIKYGSSQDTEFEYNITKHIHNISPHIVIPYALSSKCSGSKRYFYSEYQSGGSMTTWVANNMAHLRVKQMKVIIFQILYTLLRLQKREPSFRHNDLHCGNVFINDNYTAKGSMRYTLNGREYNVPNVGVSALIADFGYASTNKLKNPMYPNARLKNDHGIAPDNDPRYDMHFFLNAVYGLVVSEPLLASVRKFIESVLPPDYRGQTSSKIRDFRLNYRQNHPNLPMISDVLSHSFFVAFMSMKNRTPKSPSLAKRRGKKMTKLNTITEETRSPRRYNRNTLMKLMPLTQEHVFRNFGNNITRACLPKMKKSEIGEFIAKEGTIAAKKELTKIFVPGKKIPSKVALCQLLQSFQKGRILLRKGSPPKKKASPAKKAPAPKPASAAKKVPAPKPASAAKKAPAPAPKPASAGKKKNRMTAKLSLMKVPKGPNTKRPTQLVIPSQKNRVVLTANDRRRAKDLAERISETLVNIENFQKRENQALKMAYEQIKNEKRRMTAIGLGNSPPSPPKPMAAARAPAPPPAAKIDAKKLSMPVKIAPVKQPGARVVPQPVGQKTGRKAKLIAGSPPLKMRPESIYTLNSKERLKIRNKLCESYKKEEISNFLKKSGVTVIPSTKSEMCLKLRQKYF